MQRGFWAWHWATKKGGTARQIGWVSGKGTGGRKQVSAVLGRWASGVQEREQVKGSPMGHHRTGQDSRNGLQCHLNCVQASKEEGF